MDSVAGALSKTLDKGTRVCTYLLGGLGPQDVERPLGEFQATKADKEETRRMLQDVNKALGVSISEATLNSVFEALWPKLAEQLSSIPAPERTVPPKRDIGDMVAEILDLTRVAAKDREFQRQNVERRATHLPERLGTSMAELETLRKDLDLMPGTGRNLRNLTTLAELLRESKKENDEPDKK